jgi:hypothetical protein
MMETAHKKTHIQHNRMNGQSPWDALALRRERAQEDIRHDNRATAVYNTTISTLDDGHIGRKHLFKTVLQRDVLHVRRFNQ